MVTDLAGALARTPPVPLAIMFALVAVLAAACAWFALRSLRRARLIEDTPTAKVRSAAQGYVELAGVGRLMDGPAIAGPLSGLPCVWYRYWVEEQQTIARHGRTEQRWVRIAEGQSQGLFWLEDETGRVAIDPDGAEVTTRMRDVWYSGGQRVLQASVIAFDASLSTFGGNRRRYTEERLGEGQPLYVLGVLRSAPRADGVTVDAETRDLLRQWKTDQAALKLRFDLNGDGAIDQDEWMLARAQAHREVMRARDDVPGEASAPLKLVSASNDRSRPFLLSAFASRPLSLRYRHRAVIGTIGFAVLLSLLVWASRIRFLL